LDAFGNWLQGTQNLGRFMQLIDKADKIGFDGVSRELEANEIPNGIEAWTFLHNTSQMDSPAAILEALQKQEPIENEHLQEGIASLTALFSILDKLKLNNKLQLDLTLARGLSYYTGCVLEVVPSDDRIPADFKIGSIGGGGRYDNLTEIFGLKDVSGVGISFGLDCIYDIIESARLFPTNALQSTTILICAMDETPIPHAFSLAQSLRKAGIATEVYPTAAKLKKQLDYANAKGMHWAAIIGDQEMQSGMVTLKNLQSGEQQTIGQQAITEYIKP
jgi:histidyl-tRNA synthetase